MNTTTDLLHRAADWLRALARQPESSREDAAELRADAASLLAVADQMERAEPVAWTTGIEWGYCESETVQKLTRHEQRRYGFTQPLYAHPAPEVTRDAERYRWLRLPGSNVPISPEAARDPEVYDAAIDAAMQEPKP